MCYFDIQVLRKLNRKIHPETSTATDDCQKSQKYIFENVSFDNFNDGRVMNRVEDGITYCQEFISKEEMCYWKTNLGLPLYGVDTNVSSANRGHWIKTDAECKQHFIFTSLRNYLRCLTTKL